ncbi:MAG: 3-methyl-2-oxobutanoate hydroxymethyltransferase [Candidatus Dadabacteria bacterium]|nr:3-methyl-2-oxobutanoate hydroxymethyltransferase [Candidatus Dadabacteria bacterium]NIS10134.1 3-methyl-2-oxobutanoate hydroxymethyltransferase [Candidatus Dadabacteria bacterium]NIY23056.1 3-methyl-2-oxobutanoate hydroxymethyltransferase [Candidatus Dadabacteria bacterium]
MNKIRVPDIVKKKKDKQKLVMLTSYDAITARIVDEAGVDIILIGDSLGNVVQGQDTTLPVSIEEMIYHTRLVSRGAKRAHICADMPFMSYQTSKQHATENAGRLMKEGFAESIKLETTDEYIETIKSIVSAGIPVMGHIGLCPQSYHAMGGYKIQGRDKKEKNRYIKLAKDTESAGAYSIVLEGIPLELAKAVTKSVSIPTIGIGAGPHCDGQVLVINDLVGLHNSRVPKFVKQYADFRDLMTKAVKSYSADVMNSKFPTDENSFSWSN